MSWVYRFDERALKELRKLGPQGQRDIIAYIDERVAGNDEPSRSGKELKADMAGLWPSSTAGMYMSRARLREQSP